MGCRMRPAPLNLLGSSDPGRCYRFLYTSLFWEVHTSCHWGPQHRTNLLLSKLTKENIIAAKNPRTTTFCLLLDDLYCITKTSSCSLRFGNSNATPPDVQHIVVSDRKTCMALFTSLYFENRVKELVDLTLIPGFRNCLKESNLHGEKRV